MTRHHSAIYPVSIVAHLMLLQAAMVGGAHAQLVDCPRSSGQLTVYLDEPAVTGSATAAAEGLFDAIWLFLDRERERNWLEGEQSRVRFVRCPGRRPQIDGSEFDQDIVRLLYNDGVILELWARLIPKTTPGEPERWQAILGFLAVPLHFKHHTLGPVAPPGIHVDRYPRDPAQPAPDALSPFRQAREIDLFISLGLGIRAFRNGDLEEAQQNLCGSLLLLEKSLSEAPDAELQRIAAYVVELAQRNLDAASGRPSGDPLRELLAQRESPCPGGGS